MLSFIILLSALTILIAMNSHTLADSETVYCYDEDMEGYICFDTFKECENEEINDLTAESKCYKDTE